MARNTANMSKNHALPEKSGNSYIILSSESTKKTNLSLPSTDHYNYGETYMYSTYLYILFYFLFSAIIFDNN